MTVPSRVEPESLKRSSQQDPFLEFESERASVSGLFKPEDLLHKQLTPPPPEERPQSAISPTVAFALGVAGLVTAIVGYYQLGQFLADRAKGTPAGQTASNAAAPPANATNTGHLEISSEPAGAGVTVDGTPWGVTPLTLKSIPAGEHTVVITRQGAVVTRTVQVTPGSSATVAAVLGGVRPADRGPAAVHSSPAAFAAPPASAGAPTGWLTFEAPVQLMVFDRGQQRGTTRGGRLVLTAGTHELELVNDLYEIRQTLSASVSAGRVERVTVPMPSGFLSINATPWAEVWVDGVAVGTTPLANLKMPVGPHDVVFRHPTLGKHEQSVIVKAVTPARLGVDLKR